MQLLWKLNESAYEHIILSTQYRLFAIILLSLQHSSAIYIAY